MSERNGDQPALLLMCACYAVMLVFLVLIWCNISRRLGYSWALGILGVIPIANLIIMCVFAFMQSPNERRLREMENDLRRLEQDLDRSERRRHDIEDELDAWNLGAGRPVGPKTRPGRPPMTPSGRKIATSKPFVPCWGLPRCGRNK